MPFDASVFASLLKPVSRRRFTARVARHDGDRYDKNFSRWDHLLSLIFLQLSGAGSLLALETARRHDIRPIRFTELIRASLLARIPIETIDKPPPKRSAANTPDPRQLTIPL